MSESEANGSGNGHVSPWLEDPGTYEGIVTARRNKIAGLMLRGLKPSEIVRYLPESPNPIVNIETGKPFNSSTITRDIAWLKEQWKRDALEDLTILKGQHVAELRE